MLARQRAAIARDELRDVLRDRHHHRAILRVMDRDERADVEASDRGMRVVRGGRSVLRHDRAELLDEVGQLRGVDCGVLDEGERLARARYAVQERLARLAQLPRLEALGGARVGRHRGARKRGAERVEPRRQLVGAVCEVLDIEHRAKRSRRRLRHQLDILAVLGVAQRDIDHHIVDELDRGRLRREDRLQVRQRLAHAREADDREPPLLRLGNEREFRAQRGRERSLGAAHEVREVDPVVGARGRTLELLEEHVERIAVDMAQDLGKTRLDLARDRTHDRGDRIGDRALRGIAVAASLLEAVHAAVGEDHIERDEALDGAAVEDRVRARRVVADHPAERRVRARRDIGSEHQPVRRERLVQLVERHARLDDRASSLGIDREDRSAMLREIDDDGAVHALAGERGARSAREDRHALPAEVSHGARAIGHRTRHDHADRLDLVDARVGRVEHAVVATEADVRVRDAAQHPRKAEAQRVEFIAAFEQRKGRGLG